MGLHKLVGGTIYSGRPTWPGTQYLLFTPFNSQPCPRSPLFIRFRPTVNGAPRPGQVLNTTEVPRELHPSANVMTFTEVGFSFAKPAVMFALQAINGSDKNMSSNLQSLNYLQKDLEDLCCYDDHCSLKTLQGLENARPHPDGEDEDNVEDGTPHKQRVKLQITT